MAIRKTISKTGAVRYYEDGRRLTDKQGAIKFVRQEFRTYAQNPLLRSNLTAYEARVFRNSQNAKKGRDRVSDFARGRYRFDGKFVSDRVFKDNPILQRAYKDKNLRNYKEFEGLASWQEVSDLLDNKILYNTLKLAVPIKNEEWKPREDVIFRQGKVTEIYAALDTINDELESMGRPPYTLKVIMPSGVEIIGNKQGVKAIERFTETAIREKMEYDDVFAYLNLPYKFVWPYMVVDLGELESNLGKYLKRFGSDDLKPATK